MQASTVQHAQTGYWVGAAALSNMGFYVPTCAPQSEVTPLVFVPCPEFDALCEGKAYRVQSTQRGLDRADFWMNATDVAVPSIIYRAHSPNNQLAYVFDMVPRGDSFALRSLSSNRWIAGQDNRLVTVATPSPSGLFKIYSF